MAYICAVDEDMEMEWDAWVKDRPASIRDLIIKRNFNPWKLYLLKSSGHRVTLISFNETDPITVSVAVSSEFNVLLFSRNVFGIHPDDLEECDLPTTPGMEVLNQDQALEFLAQKGPQCSQNN